MTSTYRIFKYPVRIRDKFEVELPQSAEILDVQLQFGEPMMWALVDPQEQKVTRRFRVIGTGHPIESDDLHRLHYVGTFQVAGGDMVFHLFNVHEAATDHAKEVK